jgi:hypothetical protein
MTAEIAILNNQGIAIAADSAITIGLGWGEKKIYYTAEKIFNISRKHPIGIMVYNNSEFMGINWEIIINEYSKELGEKTFDTLEEYARHFLNFVSEFRYITADKQKEYLRYICRATFDCVRDYYDDAYYLESEEDVSPTRTQISKILTSAIKKRSDELEEGSYVYLDFFDDEYIKSNMELIKDVIKDIFENLHITDKQIEELVGLLILDIQKFESRGLYNNHSGIVITGYGEREIFPAICEVKIFGRLGNNLMRDEPDIDCITDTGQAMIYPFAQTDVINTFIRGIDFAFEERIKKAFNEFIVNIKDMIDEDILPNFSTLQDNFLDSIDKDRKSVV